MAKGVEGYKVRTITCISCGTVVTKRMPAGGKYCSLPCYRSSPRPQRRTGTTLKCAQCGLDFYVPKSRATDAKFCSNDCHNAYQGRNKTSHTCKMCGGTFRWSPSRTASGNHNITYCSIACRDSDPDVYARILSMSAMQQSIDITSAEVAGYALLDSMGVDYLPQRTFAGKFIPDAVVPSARLVIQFDGDYWHDRAGSSTEPRIRKRVSLDRSQDKYVRACGWEVVRLWESDLTGNVEGCRAALSHALSRPLGDAPARDPLARELGRPAA